jgi:hypothetical protein
MSQLLDLLEQASQGVSQPLGFARKPEARVSPMLMLGCTTMGDSAGVKKIVDAGAHALVFTVSIRGKSSESKSMLKGLKGTPWGVWVRELDPLPADGSDFEVFSSEHTGIGPFQDEKRTIGMEVRPETEDAFLRTIEDLPVDFFIASLTDVSSLDIGQLIRLARVRSFTSKYFLVYMALLPSTEEIGVLRSLGVNGLAIDVDSFSINELKEFRARFDALPQNSSQRRGERRSALLPSLGQQFASDHFDEDEDLEEDDL